MSKLTRVTAKVFGATADGTLADPEIGQFGSAKAGTYVGTGDVATIQNLSAWSNGWIDAVTPTQQFPSLPERTGVDKVLSYQNAYVLQQGIPEWDSGTDYYTNGFCSKNGKIYFSKTDNNVNNDPETDTANWEEFTSGGASRNIGEIVQSTIPLTDAGLHLLDGSLINGSGIYSDFVDYIAGLVTNYSYLFTSEVGWQDSVTNYGVCGKFVYNSTNRTVRLPKITGFVEGASGVTNLGDLTQAGLPNITGQTLLEGAAQNGNAGTGALTGSGSSGTASTGGGPGDDYNWLINLNASRSSSIYGRSNTVQPQSIKVLYYIVIATSTKTDIQVDIDEIATDLNGKADVDLTNVNNAGTSRGAGWAMPSNTYIDLTLGASGTTYTAPADGYVAVVYNTVGTFSYCHIFNPTNAFGTTGVYGIDSLLGILQILPVRKGGTYRIDYGSLTFTSFRFFYAVGSESEAN